MNLHNKKIYTVNIVSTGRCNCNCSYCHFFATRSRKDTAYDISDELFEVYLAFIKQLSERVTDGIVTYRFSGGEPMVLGDRLFALADLGYKVTGIKPFMLTAGKELSKEWVDKAKQIILAKKDDPHGRSSKVSALQKDYLQKRYGKVIGAGE